MAGFYGTEKASLDRKRRLSVPMRLRRDTFTKEIHKQFFVKYGSEGCLQLYSAPGWQVMEEKLRRLLDGDRNDRAFVSQFIKDACWVTVDSQGRLTIPSSLQDRAGLGTEVVLHGTVNYIAIWSTERFAEKAAALPDDALADLETSKLKG